VSKDPPTFFGLAIVKPEGIRPTLQNVTQCVGARIPLLANDANRFEATLLLGSPQASEKIVDNWGGAG